MKLYIYRFWRNKFVFEEVDVEEKPKMYIITKNANLDIKDRESARAKLVC
jgi:hypothetical protein